MSILGASDPALVGLAESMAELSEAELRLLALAFAGIRNNRSTDAGVSELMGEGDTSDERHARVYNAIAMTASATADTKKTAGVRPNVVRAFREPYSEYDEETSPVGIPEGRGE